MATPAYVVIGEDDDARFKALKTLIDEEFVVQIERASTFDRMKAILQSLERIYPGSVRLVLISDNLPSSDAVANAMLDRYLMDLRQQLSMAHIACVHEKDIPNVREEIARGVLLIKCPPKGSKGSAKETVLPQLRACLQWYRKVPTISASRDPSLREQLRGLDENRHVSASLLVVAQLVGRVFTWPDCHVDKLAPGLSGAKVFRVRRSKSGADASRREYVIKISHISDSWKIKEEASRHALVPSGVPGYRMHIPALVEPDVPIKDGSHAVSFGSWSAICYEFLGGEKFGAVMDLEAALIGSPARLAALTENTQLELRGTDDEAANGFRVKALEMTLEWLCREWYTRPEFVQRKVLRPWSTEDGPDRSYPDYPPYRLSGKVKGYILSFLEGREGVLGNRLFREWTADRERMRQFVERHKWPVGVALLDQPMSMVLAPSHGDLNANNALLWLEAKEHPFFIDFAMFQRHGHALQDFARLEAEIKFALMDRQENTPESQLPALDLSWTQIRIWRKLEDHLLSPDWDQHPPWTRETDFDANVRLCLRLIQVLRHKAAQVQQFESAARRVAFIDEYRPALLFHTLRAISFSSLSVFKRMLAVYSAARLIELMKTIERS
ncbi:MAG TPA: hypothetical protein VI485_02635 [Vicinamibacterales bacterium]|nr:hypothetical protein [Vicinamibacterales bacterium]